MKQVHQVLHESGFLPLGVGNSYPALPHAQEQSAADRNPATSRAKGRTPQKDSLSIVCRHDLLRLSRSRKSVAGSGYRAGAGTGSRDPVPHPGPAAGCGSGHGSVAVKLAAQTGTNLREAATRSAASP